MPNRSHEENEAILLNALRSAGAEGLNVEQLRVALFGNGEKSNTLTKKFLERLKSKGFVRTMMGRSGPFYTIIPGH